ncbi:DUF393 domain-containing protein [Nocardiopsis rhodophaea]
MTRAAPMLIYDGNCGFCTRSVRLTERLPVRVTLTPRQEIDLAEVGVDQSRAEREVLWVSCSGRVAGGADAVAELLTHARGVWPLAGHMMKLPVIRPLAAGVYRVVASHRYRLPGVTPACQLPPEQRPGR